MHWEIILMHITTYHMHNVLRAYGKQLRQGRRGALRKDKGATDITNNILVSNEARRKVVVQQVSDDIIERITKYGPIDSMEQEVLDKLETEFGNRLAVQLDSTEFIFKVIDDLEHSEETKTLSIKDSRILKARLAEITKDKITENMFRKKGGTEK